MAGLDSTADHLQDPAAEIGALRARVAEAVRRLREAFSDLQ